MVCMSRSWKQFSDQTITGASCLDVFHSCIPRVFCKSSPLSQWTCPGMPPLAGHAPLGTRSQKNISGWGFSDICVKSCTLLKGKLMQLISSNYILEPSLAFWTSQSLRNVHLIRQSWGISCSFGGLFFSVGTNSNLCLVCWTQLQSM